MRNRMIENMVLCVLTAVLVAGAPNSHAAETGSLSVVVRQKDTAAQLPCRAWIQSGGERLYTPASGNCAVYDKDRSFAADGSFVIDVPTGRATIHVERGKEYLPVDRQVRISSGQTLEVEIELQRWVNMAERNWYSGDFHCHYGRTDVDVLKLIALSDDLNFEPVSTLWNHETRSALDQWPQMIHASELFADPTHLISFRNQEIERIGGGPFESVGALLMFGLQKPVKIYPDDPTYPCDMILAGQAKASSPQCVIDTDKPIWAENVVTMAFGLFDSVQICHNHYHRNATLQLGWGMAGSDIEEQQIDWGPDELFLRTNSTYYRFLNCGFELAVTGGSAMGVMPLPLGYNRTYARLDGPLTEANYLKAIRQGRTFATSGPMLIFTANGKDCGTRIEYSSTSDKPLTLHAQLQSIEPIDKLEIIANGDVIETVDLTQSKASPVLDVHATHQFKPKRSGWVLARAIYTAADGRLRQAHTSPIYITIDGKPTASKADAQYMIRWIDRLLAVSEQPQRYKTQTQRLQSQDIFRQARRKYEKIAEQAVLYWGDGS